MVDTDIDAFLEHHGVKGMKWGVRRRSSSDNKERAKTFGKKRERERQGSAKADKPGSARGKKAGTRTYDSRKMSNKELNAVVKRMELEQRYAKLNSEKKKEGNSFIKQQLNKEGNKAIGNVAKVAGPPIIAALSGVAIKGAWDKKSLTN